MSIKDNNLDQVKPNDATQKRELLKRLLEQEKQHNQADKVATAQAKLHLKKRPAILTFLPLSFAQEALWFVDHINPEESGYNSILPLLLEGKLNLEVLHRTLETLQQRHEVLRTCFVETGEVVASDVEGAVISHGNVQVAAVIHENPDLPLTKIDISQKKDAHNQLENLVQVEMEGPFDLSRAPLYRVVLVKLNEAEHRLILTVHHLVSDGWSTGLLFAEFCQIYLAYATGREVALEPAVQYLDYAIAQRDYLTRAVVEKQLVYWKDQLSEAPQLELPRDHSRAAVASYQGRSVSQKIPAALSKAVRQLSQEQGVTVFVTMLSVFNLLMHRYSGQDDVVIGTPLMTRNTSELEKVVGLLINMAVLRIPVQADTSFRDFLNSNRKMLLDAQDNSDLPFDYLVRELQPHREANVNPFFQVTFAQDMAARPVLHQEHSGESLTIQVDESCISDNKVTRFDIEAYLRDEGDEHVIEFVANQQLFDESTVDRMLQHYINLLSAAVAKPDQPLGLLPMLDDQERQQIINDWNQSQIDYPSEQTVQALFEQQAGTSPDALAVEYGDESLSYAQLNARANRLAHYLQARGVGPEVMVGLYLERGLEMVVGLLGILKAGGAYVPLDLDYPPPRIGFMLEDASVPVLLSHSSLRGQLPDYGGELICVDSDWSSIELESDANPASSAGADNLAYVIYTSGSTGRPKGVEIQQRAIVRLVRNTDYYQVDSSDRVAQASSISFDAATFELWAALLNGARLVGVAKDMLLNPRLLAAFLREREISAMFLTTALFNQIAREVPDAFSGLRGLMFGGEAVDPGAVREVLQHGPPQRLLHVYGPTESTTFASWHRVGDVPEDATTVPIGRPLANTTLYVLDKHLQPVPVGVPGELCIGGDGLARGYLNQAEATAEKFVNNPFNDDPAARLYRTGDLVRYREDGTVEFVGRIDHQVKLRGFRIELGEIETSLSRQDAVKDALVMVREDDAGDKRLVAYVVPTRAWQQDHARDEAGDADAEISQHVLISGLRQHTRAQLPAYMVPSDFMVLDEFPLNANGKVERKALPLPGDVRVGQDLGYSAPRNETERQLARIWADILKREQVGIHDNFFDLGGHSLKMTQIVSRIREQLNVELPLAEMFRHLTLAEMAPMVESLMNDGSGDTTDVIAVVDRDAELPLSFAQERLWFLDRLQPGNPAYIVSLAMRLEGELHVDALQASLSAIVVRHEALRTRFVNSPAGPVQIIDDAVSFELRQTDLSAFAAVDLDQEVAACLQAEKARSFDLSIGPLIRGSLIHMKNDEYILQLTMHHIVSDGWSLGLLFGELGKGYAAFSHGEQPQLVELPIQYADFASWQRLWLTGTRLDKQLAYWSKQLEDLQVLELPMDRTRPAIQTYDGAHELLALDEALSEQLNQLSKDNDVTLFMTLLTVFMAMLHRYSGQDDIVIGSPIANRNRSEVEGLIAFFVNTLVMRVDCSGNPGFTELVQRVSQMSLDAYSHQDIPFERLVEVLQVDRDQSRNPLFQVQFALQNAPLEPLRLQGLTLEQVIDETQVTRFDLECHVLELAGQSQIGFVYNTNLFDAATIKRMQQHFVNLLAAAVAEPNRPIGLLPMLDRDERDVLLEQWNQTQTDYMREQSVHALFEQQAAASPQAIAVEFGDASLTYAQLNARANQLARYLQEKGVGAEVMVGLCLERSLELPVVILGILKAGGVYVPMDPEYPTERLAFILEDCAAPLLMTQTGLQSGLPDYPGQVIYLDTDWPAIEQQESADLGVAGLAEHAAYVIYTSGSTGQPKGVVVTHANVTRLFAATEQWYGFNELDVWTLFHSSAFDFSVWEIWGALLHGGRLVVVPYAVSRSPKLFHKLLSESAVTVLNQTPSAFKQLMTADEGSDPESLDALRLVIFGGEALDPQSLMPWFEKHGDQQPRLVNMYGITETTVHVSYRPLTLSMAEGGPSLIGQAIPDLQIYILDRHLEPVPVGVPGEMYIGGAGLARGYLNRAELTVERFITHPFSDEPGARLYKTGDLARYLADGDIEYLGRSDHQVKLRGFRIELGEIESLLNRHDAVREAVVLCRDDETLGRRLLAYVIADGLVEPSVAELRDFVRKSLPEYMVPTVFMVLDSFPLTANGKLDKRALPMPDGERQSVTAFAMPRNGLERQMVEIWQQVLDVAQIGIHDSFFDLGGHSMLATQILSRIHEQLKIELPLADMFGYPTVAELATIIGNSNENESGYEAIPVVSREFHLPLSFAQERFWFLCQLDPGNTTYNMPFAFKLSGTLDVDALQSSLCALVERHESLRTAIRSDDGRPYLFIAEKPEFKMLVENLRDIPEADCDAVIQQRSRNEWREGFDLEQAPLFRARLLCVNDQEYVLLVTLHHIIFDGWSFNIFSQELSALYQQYRSGAEAALAPMKLQFADYASWLRQWLQGDNLSRQLEFWKKSLADYEVLNLPTDHARPSFPSYRGKAEGMIVGRDLLDKLRSFARKHDATLYMMLLSAFNVLLHRYSDQKDIIVGSPVAGRNRQDIEGIIGFFVNILVIRTKVSPELNFIDILNRARQASLDAHSHQDIPFEKLVEELHPDRDASRNPLFQVLFNFVDASEYGLSLSEIDVSMLDNPLETTKFDLTLCVFDMKDSLQLRIDYSVDLYTAATIQEMLSHFVTLLESIVENPHSEISALPLLSQTQLEKIGRQRNRVEPDILYEPVSADRLNQTIPEVFDEVCGKYGSKPAVVTQDYNWTYAELLDLSNAVANKLLQSSTDRDEQVALLFPHDAPMLAAIMGVLKAGKTYVPLDPHNPPARLSLILEDSEASILLVDDSYLTLAEQLRDDCLAREILQALEIVSFGACQQHLSSAVVIEADPGRTPESITYLLYTSGTTGEPKAVMQNDRNVLHHSRVYSNSLHLRAKDHLSLFASYSFDAGVMDIYAALLNGATLHPYDMRSSEVINIGSWLNGNKIDVLHLTPTLYRHLFGPQNESIIADTVRVVVLGGEAVSVDDFVIFQKHFNDTCLFVNGLGPTESTTTLQYWMDKQTKMDRQVVPIGFPVEDTDVLLLDSKGKETDVFGEIAVKSKYVSCGYWRQPALNKEKFLSDNNASDTKIYRTGDMGRRRLDGYIEYTGRKDRQIKIRGYRIETGEVEAALCLHDQVNKAAVTTVDNTGEIQLVAYIVLTKINVIPVDAVRIFIKDKLPAYMLPSLLIEIDELPMTSTGKLAKHLLPEPDFSHLAVALMVAPETETERVLQTIWNAVLQLETCSVTSNFFDLGGHSLKATQVVSRIRNEFEISLSLRVIFAYPTISEMATYIDTELQGTERITRESDQITAAGEDQDEIDLDELNDDEVELLLGALTDSKGYEQ